MNLVLLNLKSKQTIVLDGENPLIIGRKNVGECNDKRVSRNHGKVTCTQDGKVILSALHSNPCFYTRNGVPPVLQLNKNEEEILNEGDCLGLLPDSFWFQIKSKANHDKVSSEKLELNQPCTKSDESKSLNLVNKDNDLNSKEIIIGKELEMERTNQNNYSLNLNNVPANITEILNSEERSEPVSSKLILEPQTCLKYGDKDFEQTRRLPLWMYQIDEPEDQISQNLPNNSRNKIVFKELESKKAKTETKNLTSEKSATKCCEKDLKPNINNSSMAKDGYESDVKVESVPGTSKRPICQYEGNCYRKNSQHKIDFCHPGDKDYISYEKRPMCQYGASCYRKNKIHKVQFRHCTVSLDEDDNHWSSQSSCSCPSPPVLSPTPVKRKRKTVKRQSVCSGDFDDDDKDEYNLEDPFINDASSDEYLPSEVTDNESDAIDSDDD